MRRRILSHPYYLDEDNVEELESLDFVFIEMDSGNCKRVIVDFLRTHSISFIDTGIGIVRTEVSLIGTTRSTLSIRGNTQTADQHISYAEADKDLYQSNMEWLQPALQSWGSDMEEAIWRQPVRESLHSARLPLFAILAAS